MDVGEPVGEHSFDIPHDIIQNLEENITRHSRSLPSQKQFALITLCLLAKAGVDVVSRSTDSDTLRDGFDRVRKTVQIDDLLSAIECKRVQAKMKAA